MKTLIIIVILHWIADFVFQDEKWALSKSSSWLNLVAHTGTYSIVFLIMLNILTLLGVITVAASVDILIFVGVTFIFHTGTDYLTSKFVSKRFEYETPFKMTMSANWIKKFDIFKSNTGNDELIIMSDVLNNPSENSSEYMVKRYNSVPNLGAFSLIGFDQVLHYIQLAICWNYFISPF